MAGNHSWFWHWLLYADTDQLCVTGCLRMTRTGERVKDEAVWPRSWCTLRLLPLRVALLFEVLCLSTHCTAPQSFSGFHSFQMGWLDGRWFWFSWQPIRFVLLRFLNLRKSEIFTCLKGMYILTFLSLFSLWSHTHLSFGNKLIALTVLPHG